VVIPALILAQVLSIAMFYVSARILRIRDIRPGRFAAMIAIMFLLIVAILAIDLLLPHGSLGLELLIALAGICLTIYVIKRTLRTGVLRAMGCYFLAMALSLGVGLAARATVLEAFSVPTGVMSPTILPGERVLMDKLMLRFRLPARGDVVVFHRPDHPKENYIQRVVAVGGDRIEIRDDELYVNDTDAGSCKRMPNYRLDTRPELPAVVPEGKLFLLGDNRDASLDSRYLGFSDASSVIALAGIVYASQETLPFPAPPGARTRPGRIRWERIGTVVR
jgi:signal peptidase I